MKEAYAYDGFTRILGFDLTKTNSAQADTAGLPDLHRAIHAIFWDPTQPVATRPLVLMRGKSSYHYGHDHKKNVTELYDHQGNRKAHYNYSSFGHHSISSDIKENPSDTQFIDINPFHFSSEAYDPETALTYYNYRYYNPTSGNWISRDPLEENAGLNLYNFVNNNPAYYFDELGLEKELFENQKDAFKKANELVVEAMEARFEKDKAEWERKNPPKPFSSRPLNDSISPKKRIAKPNPTSRGTPMNAEPKPLKNPTRKIEYGARICKNKECKYYVGEVGTSDNSLGISASGYKPCDDGDETVGLAHSHPSSYELSQADKDTADNGFGYIKGYGEGLLDKRKKIPPGITISSSVRVEGQIITRTYKGRRPKG